MLMVPTVPRTHALRTSYLYNCRRNMSEIRIVAEIKYRFDLSSLSGPHARTAASSSRLIATAGTACGAPSTRGGYPLLAEADVTDVAMEPSAPPPSETGLYGREISADDDVKRIGDAELLPKLLPLLRLIAGTGEGVLLVISGCANCGMSARSVSTATAISGRSSGSCAQAAASRELSSTGHFDLSLGRQPCSGHKVVRARQSCASGAVRVCEVARAASVYKGAPLRRRPVGSEVRSPPSYQTV